MVVEVKSLTKRFGGLVATNNISLSVNEKEIVGLIGPNGAGKTTLFNLITGDLLPDEGNVIFCGKDITHMPTAKRSANGLARTFQVVKPFGGMTVLENVMVSAFCHTKNTADARRKAYKVLEDLNLSHKQDALGKTLTIADRKRLEVARALALEPKLLLLDEVFAGLNETEVNDVMPYIKEMPGKGIAVLLIEHKMSVIMKLSQRIIVLNYGEKIAEGVPEDIVKNQQVIQAYLGEGYSDVRDK